MYWLQTFKIKCFIPFFSFLLSFLFRKKNYHSRERNIYIRETFNSKNKTSSKAGGERFSIQVTSLEIYLANLTKKCAIESLDFFIVNTGHQYLYFLQTMRSHHIILIFLSLLDICFWNFIIVFWMMVVYKGVQLWRGCV